jgi:Ti-type conjugative transfer relaxase TraA
LDRDFQLAIYYFDAKVISRPKGQSVVACAAYRAGDKLYDDRYEKLHDYTRKQGIEHSEILLPENAPAWMGDRQKLWNTVEQVEKRKDAQLAREVKFALPRELTIEQNRLLARDFIQHVFVEKGMVADWSLHLEKASDGGMQPHVHVLLTMREIKGDGFGQKVREWNKKENLLEWREKCAAYSNQHLAMNGHDLRIDHRTLAEQGIDLIPQDKIGTVAARHRLDALKAHQRASRENGERILADPSILLNNITCQQSTFNDHDIARFVSRHTADADQFQAVYEKVKASPELMTLGTGDDGRDRFTTRNMFALENDIQRLSEKIGERKHIRISSRFIQSTLDQYHQKTGKQLTDEQFQAVGHILKSDSISCMVGRAGTGKSFSLGAAKAVWEEKGLRVHGIALSGVAADGLSKGSGMNGRTIESFCSAIEKGHLVLNRRDVIVMDEAGMTDSVSMQRVIKAVHAARAKLVLVGDPDQLQPVGPGAIFRSLLHLFGFSEIVTVYRQDEEWQRQATRNFAAGEVAKGIEAYQKQGCVHFERDEATAMDRLVKDWEKQSHDKPIDSLIVIAHTNEQVNKLNLKVRESRLQQRTLAEGHQVNTLSGSLHLAKDDRILFLKNDAEIGVKNGRFAKVVDVKFSETGRVLGLTAQLDGDEKKTVQFSPEKYKDFTYGYAATVHKLQGATYGQTFNYIGGTGWDKYLTYVASTRHKNSCNLYVNQTDYPDLEALSTRLGRRSLKDSVLDFPRAFAERRGIDTSGLFKQLPKHLGERLSQLKEKVRDRYAAWAEPEAYWRKKQEGIERQARVDARYQGREDAKWVAAYVDTHRLMGCYWQALQTKMEQMGIKKLDYASDTYSLIAATQEHALLHQSSLLRDQLAAQLVKDPGRYGRAVKEAGISMKKLEAQALSQARRDRIQAYIEVDKSGKVVLRDRLAAEIASDFKGHYRLLKENRVGPLQVRDHAIAHVKRKKMLEASPAEREAYRAVACYQTLTRQIGKEVALEKERHGQNKDAPIRYADAHYSIKKCKAINVERGRIASTILKNPDQFEKALDFYQIGKAEPLFNEPIRSQSQQYAQNRWYKLQTQAVLHDNRDRMVQYQTAQVKKDASTARVLAHSIMRDIKSHHGAVVELSSSSSELWRSIRQDAKAHERDQVLNKLSPLEKEGFKHVENYVAAKRDHNMAWREIFESKKSLDLSDTELNERLAPFSKQYTKLRDRFAADILKDLPSHHAGLLYHNIAVSELDKPAYAQVCRERTHDYAEKQNDVMGRAKLAQTMIEDPKAHHAALIEKGLSWRDVYRDAKPAEQKAFFAHLSTDEKQLLRTLNDYRAVNRHIGRAWSKVNTLRERVQDSSEKTRSIDNLVAKRDRIAVRLLDKKELIEINSLLDGKSSHLSGIESRVRIDWKKLEKHAGQHQARLIESVKCSLDKPTLVSKAQCQGELKQQAAKTLANVISAMDKKEQARLNRDVQLKEMRAIATEFARQHPEQAEKLKQQVWGPHKTTEKNETKVGFISQNTPITPEQRAYYEARFVQIVKENEIHLLKKADMNKGSSDRKLTKSVKSIQKSNQDIDIEIER